MAIVRDTFSRVKDYVAVKRIRLTSIEFIEPGQEIDKNKFKLFQIMRWYKMRRIGVKDSLWSQEMLKQVNNAHARPEVTAKPEQVKKEVTKKPRQVKAKSIAQDLPKTIEPEVKPFDGVSSALSDFNG